MKTFDKVTVFLIIFGCAALSFIADPMEYLGACFLYVVLLGGVKLMIHEIYGADDEQP